MTKAASTRQNILQQAFNLVYTKGYRTTSIDDILATTKVTKGAFYYHFKNKDEMGLAMINELMMPSMYEAFVQPISNSRDPIKDIFAMMKHLLFDNPYLKVQHGCPAGNLTQEMTPWNAEFSEALSRLITQWQEALIACVNNGRKAGNIRKDVNGLQVAYFVMSGYWGIRNFGKLYNSSSCYESYLKELKQYLKSLK